MMSTSHISLLALQLFVHMFAIVGIYAAAVPMRKGQDWGLNLVLCACVVIGVRRVATIAGVVVPPVQEAIDVWVPLTTSTLLFLAGVAFCLHPYPPMEHSDGNHREDRGGLGEQGSSVPREP